MEMETDEAAPKKTVEQWATEKKMLPRSTGGRVLQPAAPVGSLASFTATGLGQALRSAAPVLNAQSWKFDAAKTKNRWPEGFETTEAEFDAAIVDATDLPI